MQHQLRFLQGRSFHWAKYSEEDFRSPNDHCRICAKRITANPGYVILPAINVPGQPEWLQWDWVCGECFGRYQERANWTALEGEVDARTHRRFSEHVEETLRRREIQDPPPAEGFDLQVTWTAEDVVSIAAARGLQLGHEKASALHWRNRRRLMAGADSVAYQEIGEMLERYAKKLQC